MIPVTGDVRGSTVSVLKVALQRLLTFVSRKTLTAVGIESNLPYRRITALDSKHPGATSTGIHGHSLGGGDGAQNAWRVIGHRMGKFIGKGLLKSTGPRKPHVGSSIEHDSCHVTIDGHHRTLASRRKQRCCSNDRRRLTWQQTHQNGTDGRLGMVQMCRWRAETKDIASATKTKVSREQ